jgi:hypothetical protein
MSLGGTYAAYDSKKIKQEDPWASVNINEINK